MARRAVAKLFDWQKLNSPNGKNWYMIQGRPTGKRERFYFETETEAKKAVADRNRQIAAFGSQNTLPDSDRVMAAECIKMLIPFGKTLYQATHFYRDYLEKATTSINVNELCDRVAGEFDRRLKGNEFRSNRHHISMNETIRKFRAKFGGVPIKTLTGTTIKAWLALEPLAVKHVTVTLATSATSSALLGNGNYWTPIRSRRLNLLMTLSPFIKTEGPIIPRKKLQFAKTKATRASDITWKQNCLRHSFCSYAVAVKGLDWTAIQADHDTKMLKKHYLEVVTKEDAAKYWAIRPDDS